MQQHDNPTPGEADNLSAGERKAELLAELERVKQEEHEEEHRQAERERGQEAEQHTAALDPKQKAIREEIERRADEALDREWPTSWQPHKQGSQDPHKLVGLVTRIDPSVGPSKTFGTYSAVIELKATDSHEWTIWANQGGALYEQLVRLRVQPGEVVAVHYRGLKPSERNPGQSYQDFRLVRVEEDEGEPQRVDYDALERSEEVPAALPAPQEETPGGDDDIPF